MLQMISSQNLSRVTLLFFLDRKELFHSKNGARKTAKKILIVITDGQKYKDPLKYSNVIPQADRANIIRYAIGVRPLPHGSPRLSLHLPQAEGLAGSSSSAASLPQVGDAFQDPTARQELNIIGSVPSEDHVFKVDNFAALSNIQQQLQEKIFAVEGKRGVTLGLGILRVATQLSPSVLKVHPCS